MGIQDLSTINVIVRLMGGGNNLPKNQKPKPKERTIKVQKYHVDNDKSKIPELTVKVKDI